MTDQIFFDTDCISAFLWTGQGSIVSQLYRGKIVIPQMVFDELSRVQTQSFHKRLGDLVKRSRAEIWDIEVSSKAFSLYRKMTSKPEPGFKIIGKGEASAMSLAYYNNGIVGSNNFRDTAAYIDKLDLRYTTTGDILIDAYESAFIDKQEAEAIWADMVAANRWLGAKTFSEYCERPYKPLKQ